MTSATNKSSITELRSKLLKALKTAFGAETPGWRAQNFEILLEIEAILYLHHHILGCDRIDDVDQSWALVSGYFIPGLNDSADLRAKCLRLRTRLRYIRTASAWRTWLKWYQEQAEALRSFQINRDGERSRISSHQNYFQALHDERQTYYLALLEAPMITSESRTRTYASVGTYEYEVDRTVRVIEISEALAQYAELDAEQPKRPLLLVNKREPIIIDLAADDLRNAAQQLTDAEKAAHLPNPRDWTAWLLTISMKSQSSVNESELACFTIDGLFHLVGMLGSGKSSLIKLLTFYLTTQRGLHVTIVTNTVVETIRFADWLCRVGVSAAPALGRTNRADHIAKYGLANADELRLSAMLSLDAPNIPALRWLVAPCALSGLQPEPIPIGKEPCFNLVTPDDPSKRYRCPLLPICPVHQVSRDLVESQV